jgi:hypothetical protein
MVRASGIEVTGTCSKETVLARRKMKWMTSTVRRNELLVLVAQGRSRKNDFPYVQTRAK